MDIIEQKIILKIKHCMQKSQLIIVLLSHLEIVRDVTKEILRRNLIQSQTRQGGAGWQHYLVLNKISTL